MITTVQRTNSCKNPALGVDSTGWTLGFPGTGGVASTSRTSVTPIPGVLWAFRMTWTTAPSTGTVYAQFGRDTADDLNVTPGQTVTFSAYGRISWDTAQTGINIVFWTSAGAYVTETNAQGLAPVGANVWARRSYTTVIPATAARATVRLLSSGVIPSVGDWLEQTAVLAEASPTLGAYFDGDTLSTDAITYTWTGGAHASASREVVYLSGTNLTVGRFGTEIRVDDVTGWDEQGDRITVTGQTPHGSVPDTLTLRQQLMGYVGSPDETFVPVTWADQPEVNGYYRVLSADMSPNPRAAFAGVYDFRVDLARVQGAAAPLIESVILGKLRTTTLPLTQRRTQSVPAGSRSYAEFYPDTGGLAPSALSVRRAGESSVLNVFSGAGDVMVGQFYLPPVKFYEGAATVVMGGRVVAGRQVQNTPSDWMIGNDIIQVEPVPGDDFAIRIRMWNVGAWSTWQTITFKWENPAVNPRKRLKFPHTITIMSNSPEAATVRLLTTTGAASGGDYSPISVDFTIRRGSRTVAVYLRSVFRGEFAAEIAGFTSPTAITGGFSKTTSGITTFIGSAVTLGIDSSDVYSNQDIITAVDRFAFGVGLTNSSETAQTLLNEYFWAGSEKQSVVAR